MVDPQRRPRRRSAGLPSISDAKTGKPDHVEIVGAIADGERLRRIDPPEAASSVCISASSFAAPPRIGSATTPVRRPAPWQKRVGPVLVKTDGRRDRAGENGKAAGHKGG